MTNAPLAELQSSLPLCLPPPRRRRIKDFCACRKQRQRRKAFNALFKVRHRINSVTVKCCLLSFSAGPEKNLQVTLDFDIQGRKNKTHTRSDSGENLNLISCYIFPSVFRKCRVESFLHSFDNDFEVFQKS